MRPGLVDIIEASYQVQGDAETWMAGVGEAVDAHLGHGLGLIAIRYHIGQGHSIQPLSVVPVNMPSEGLAAIQSAMHDLPPEYVASTFASSPCDMARSTGSADTQEMTKQIHRKLFEPHGWYDCMVINGLDPTGNGVCFGVWLPSRQRMTSPMRQRWSRVAAHLAAANRLRNRTSPLRSDDAEAVLTSSGRLEHAADVGKSADARVRLADGVRALDRSRGKLRRTDPDLALAERKALIAARWTLLDHFESDGKHYVLAQRNEAVTLGFQSLTPRERQALGFAALGHPNKLIAYEMGIAASTVSVLLVRAARKLGTSSRADLIATYMRLCRT